MISSPHAHMQGGRTGQTPERGPNSPDYCRRLFAGVDERIVAWLKCSSVLHRVRAHKFVFDQYSRARAIYVVEKGVVMVERSAPCGQRQVFGFSYPGDFIGLSPNDGHFEYSLQSLSEAEVREFPIYRLSRCAGESEALEINMRRIRGSISSHAIDLMVALGQKKAHERVCYLLQEIRERGVGPSETVVDLPMSRQDMADYLGLTIETVSRAIRRLRDDGVIEIEGSYRVHLLKPDVVHSAGRVSGR